MAKKRKDKEELLVDIQGATENAQSFVEKNRLTVFGIIGAIALAFGLIFAFQNFYKKPKSARAQAEMFKAEQYFKVDSFAKALTNPNGAYPGFQEIIDEYGSTPAGNLAQYYSGVCFLRLGKYEAALESFQDYSPKGDITPGMRSGLIGDCHAELEEFDRALSNYEKAAKSENDFVASFYSFKAGMLSKKLGDNAKALKYFEIIRDEYPDTDQGQKIERYISQVAG